MTPLRAKDESQSFDCSEWSSEWANEAGLDAELIAVGVDRMDVRKCWNRAGPANHQVYDLQATQQDQRIGGFYEDRDLMKAGKKAGGGVCINVNEQWCSPAHITEKQRMCDQNIELLAYNNISLIEDDAFCFNPFLEYLDIFNNSLRAIPALAIKPLSSGKNSSVTNLALDDLVLGDISNPDILRFDWRFTWFSKVRRLTIKNVNFNFVPCDAWSEMKMVELLDVSNNRMQDIYLYNRKCQYSGTMRSLNSFNLSTNELSSLSDIESLTREFWQLKVLDLSHNKFGSKEGACIWKSNITRMILHHNNFISSTLNCLPTTLQYLDLSFCNLDQVDMLYFRQATNLKELLLSGNKIKFIPSGWSNPALLSLTLDGNSFGLISMSSFENMPSLSKLKAGNNPYHCTCDLHAFIQETTTKGKVNITDWPDNYKCYHPEAWLNTVVAKFFPGRIACDIRLVIVISVVITTVVVLAVIMLCYVFNVPWYAKATYQILRAKYRAHKEGQGVLQTYTYHAFISYSHSDADWVRDKLLPCLENSKPPYKICIHERDFMPGRWIIDNIIDNMENSRKVIFVLSRHFVNSEWCNYELYFANQRAIGKTFNDVVLVVKEPIEANSLPNKYCKLKKMLSTKTYLEWPHEAKQQVFFWAQLKSVLGKPSLTKDHVSGTRSSHSEADESEAELPMDDIQI
ncbi:hypothetical protein GJAV_G00008760 [Gymnothorax javanicus]|nr:hypothetical protein GJAV_G00008760 [Gymnothorax javanicus]